MRTLNKIITKLDMSRGAPMGRPDVKPEIYRISDKGTKTRYINGKRIFDSAVPMIDGAYDKGGAYWGIGKQLRVEYTKDLTYIRFYRLGEKDTI